MVVALIADSEPGAAQLFSEKLKMLWPDLHILPHVTTAEQVWSLLLKQRPQLVFFDIALGGPASGLELAKRIQEAEFDTRCVLVTADPGHALAAFEYAVFDYLLKPVADARLQKTVERLKACFAPRPEGAAGEAAGMLLDPNKLQLLLQSMTAACAPRLRMIRALQGNELRLIRVEEVCYFEASDKYVRVVTAETENLVRTPLKELHQQLDPQVFWQVHRSLIVNIAEVAAAYSEDNGQLRLALRRRPETLRVSRQYTHLFRQM